MGLAFRAGKGNDYGVMVNQDRFADYVNQFGNDPMKIQNKINQLRVDRDLNDHTKRRNWWGRVFSSQDEMDARHNAAINALQGYHNALIESGIQSPGTYIPPAYSPTTSNW